MITSSPLNLLKEKIANRCKPVFGKYIPITGFALSSSLVFAAPDFSSTFTPTTVGPGSATKLTYTITNNDVTVANDANFTAVLPSGLLHATPVNAQTDCSNGTLSASDGGSTLTFTDYDIAVGSSCTVTLDVIASNTAGVYQLPVINLTSGNGHADTTATDLTVVSTLPGVTVSSSPNSINLGAVSTLSFTIDNTQNASRVGNLDYSIDLPSGLVVADVPNASTDCVSGSAPDTTITAQAGSNSITLDASGSNLFAGFEVLGAGATCTFSVDVKSSGLGEFVVKSNSLLADFTDAGFATTGITATPAFALMSFAPNPAVPGSTTQLNIALTNYSRSDTATNVAFTDDLNAVISGMAASGLPLSVCGGTISGTTLLSFSGGSIAPGDTCSFSVPVSVPPVAAVGDYTNTTSSFSFDLNSTPQNWSPVSHNLAVTQAPVVELELLNAGTLLDEAIVAGNDLVARFTITNIDPAQQVTDIAFNSELTKALPFPISVVSPTLNASDVCGSGSLLSNFFPGVDAQGIQLTGGNISAGGSCTFDVTITVPTSQPAGTYTVKAENGTASLGGETPLISDTSDTFTVITAPSLNLSLAGAVIPGGTIDATFTLISNGNSEIASNIGFTVDLNAALSGLTASSISANTCSQLPTGTSTLSAANITLASGSSCSFIATLNIPTDATTGTSTITSSLVSATVDGVAVSSAAASADLQVVELQGSVSVADAKVEPGDMTQLNFTLTNLSVATDMSGIFLTLNLQNELTGLAATSLPTEPCGVGSSITGTTFLVLTGANLTSGNSCNFSVDVLVPVSTDDGSYALLSSSISSSTPSFVVDPITTKLVVEEDLVPSVLSLTSSVSPLTAVTPIPMEIRFSEDIEDFSVSDLVVSNGVASNLLEISTDKFTFDITPNSDGVTITAQLPAGVVNELGSGAQVNTASSVFSIDYDTTALPSAVISVVPGSKTNSETLSATVTYSNTTEVFLTNDKVNLLFTGTASTVNFVDNETTNPDISILNGNTTTPTILISNITGDGTLTLGIDSETARNNIGNVAAIADSANSFSIDNTSPTLAISSSAVDPINGSFVANFDFTNPALSSTETSITGFDVTDIILNNANISNFTGSNGSYSATITPLNDGIVTVNVNSAAAQDDHGNDNTAAATFTINYDGTKPNVSITSVSSLNNGPFTATVTFTEPVTGFSITDITATNANLSNFTSVSSTEYTLEVEPITDGVVTLDIASDLVIDSANNGNAAALQFSASYDATNPTLAITGPSASQNTAFTATFTYSENVSGFALSDIIVSNGVASNLQGSGAVYTVTITPSSEGSITIDVPASRVLDAYGNGNIAAPQFSLDYDSIQPNITISGPAVAQNASFTVTFTFDEDVTGFDLSDITVGNGGASSLQGSGSSYTALITPISDGLVSVNVAASSVVDGAGNSNTSSNRLNVVYDATRPTLAISGPNSAQNTAFMANFTFSESVAGFTLSDITVGNGTVSNLQGGGANYTAIITPTNNGNVTIDVDASVVSDIAGNTNESPSQFLILFDDTNPEVSLTTSSLMVSESFEVISTFSETTSTLNSSAFTVSNGVVQVLEKISDTSYKVIIQPTQSGTVSLALNANSVSDEAGNGNLASNILEVEYSNELVTVVLDAPEKANSTFLLGISFSSAVTGFDISDIQTSNATLSNFKVLSSSSFSVDVLGSTLGEIELSIPEKVALDEFGNGNLASAQITVQFDNVGPSLQSRIPQDKSDTVSVNTPFSVTYDEAIELGNGQIKLVDLSDSSELVATQLNVHENKLTFEFVGALKVSTTYKLLVDAGVVTDPFGNKSESLSTWTFTTSNSAPIANDDSVSTSEDQSVTINVAANDTDSDGELDLTSITLSGLNKGTAKVTSSGEVEFTPEENFYGIASFTYSIADNSGIRSNEAAVSIQVTSVNDAPEFTSEPIVSTGILADYEYLVEVSDVDSENLTVVIVDAPEWLSLNELSLNGLVPSNVNGETFNVTLEVSDGELSKQQSFILQVTEFDESLITISQNVSASPILIDQPFIFSISIANSSTQNIELNNFSLTLEGANVLTVDERCSTFGQGFMCSLVSTLDSSDSIELVFELQAIEAGEFKSVAELLFNEEIERVDHFAKNIVNEVFNQTGEVINIDGVNHFTFGDFNNDGLVDIIFAANLNSAIFLNKGAGEYELGVNLLENENVKYVAVADFDQNGFADIAFASEGELGSGILYNSGDLVFSEAQVVTTTASQKVFTGDVDGDTFVDIIFLDNSAEGLSIFKQPFSNNSFNTKLFNGSDKDISISNASMNEIENSTQVQISPATEVKFNDLAAVDMNGDDIIDLILAVEGHPLEIWYQNASGIFEASTTQLLDASKVKVVDLGFDGVMDIIAITEQGLEILDSQTAQSSIISSVSYQSIEVAPLTTEDNFDIVALSQEGDISLFSPTDSAYKLQPVVFDTESGTDIALVDVDQDADLDLIISSSSENEVRYNQGNGLFGEQTTDLALSASTSALTVTQGDSAQWFVQISNNGLATALNAKFTIFSEGAEISSIETDSFTCIEETSSYICTYSEAIDVSEEVNVAVNLSFNTLGTALIQAAISNDKVDDDSSNNMVQLSVDTQAVVVTPEPPKKKSSGNIFYLLVVLFVLSILRRQIKA